MITLFSCKNKQELPTVKEVNINNYLGEWYEIARLPNRFEKGLECVTATYSLNENGKIDVLNKGFSVKNKEEFKTAKGIAWIPDSKCPGRLKVSFFRPFSGKYYIIALDKEYKYALVGDPSRKYLWVLSRTKKLEDVVYSNLINIAKSQSFDVNKMILVNQDCN
ncbi:MAG: lipocalin family protein [Bacteroidales bacterium]|jgi:apolipoprotein D and lipocalin family protein|nr:lipocalin family protein [Bacteroidales bacterium]